MLYKYLPPNRVDILHNLKIRFSPLKSLNDPFEHQPLIDIEKERDNLLSEAKSELYDIWSSLPEREKTKDNYSQFQVAWQNGYDHINQKVHPHIVGQKTISMLGDNLGVLSLSRTEDNLLMWSHYAEEGRGFIIGFDEQHDFFNMPAINGETTRPIPVIYTNKRSHINPSHPNLYQKLLCEKPREWGYEEEERVFIYHPDKNKSIGIDQYNQNIILTTFPKAIIKNIILGYNISKDIKKNIFSSIKQNDMICDIFQARVSKTEYKIELECISSHNKKLVSDGFQPPHN